MIAFRYGTARQAACSGGHNCREINAFPQCFPRQEQCKADVARAKGALRPRMGRSGFRRPRSSLLAPAAKGKCKMQNAKCKSQNGRKLFPILHFAFCILHFDFLPSLPVRGAFCGIGTLGPTTQTPPVPPPSLLAPFSSSLVPLHSSLPTQYRHLSDRSSNWPSLTAGLALKTLSSLAMTLCASSSYSGLAATTNVPLLRET